MKSIIKKEIKQMFVSPAYFLILAIFIWILNFLFLKWFFLDWIMDFRNYFNLEIWFLMIFIPAISMRIMSEEFKNNSIEFLLTKPISILKIIFWKYLSQIIYFLLFIFSSIFLYFSLSFLWDFQSWIIFSQILWSILLVCAMFATSFLASSITKNQVFAFLLWVLINFVFIIIWTSFIEISLPYFLANFLSDISYFSHFDNFSKWIISLWDVLYFLSIIFFSIYLSNLSINNYKKSWKVWLFFSSWIELAVILMILLFANGFISKSNMFLDLTQNKIYTLSDATKSILKNTNDIINIDLYASKELPPQLKIPYTRVKDLIWQFNKYSWNNIHLTEINPVQDDKERNALQDWISPIKIQILKDDQYATQKWYLWLSIKYVNKAEAIPYLGNTKNLEYSLISKILKLTNKNKKELWIFYSSDFDKQTVSTIDKILSENYSVNLQKIDDKTKSLKLNSDAYLILEWDKKFWTWVTTDIKSVFDKKPVVYFFQDSKVDTENWLSFSKNSSELEKNILKKFNLKIWWLVWDAKYNSAISFNQWNLTYRLPYPLFPKVFLNKELPISEWNSEITTPFISNIISNTWTDLISTSQFWFLNKSKSILPDDLNKITKSDLQTISLAKIIKNWNSQIALIPDTYLLTMWWQKSLLDNLKFISNLVDYIWWDQRLISIRSKSLNYNSFVTEKKTKDFIRALNIFVLPFILLFLWIAIAFFRNKKRS